MTKAMQLLARVADREELSMEELTSEEAHTLAYEGYARYVNNALEITKVGEVRLASFKKRSAAIARGHKERKAIATTAD